MRPFLLSAEGRGKLALTLVMAVAASAVAAGSVIALGARSGDDVALRVNGTGISRTEIDQYAAVLVDSGAEVSDSTVVEALINQVIVRNKAETLGLTVADEQVDEIVAQWKRLGEPQSALASTGGLSALRDRARVFLLFKQVRSRVIRIEASEDEIGARWRVDPAYQALSLQEAAPLIRAQLEADRMERAWVDWLARQRACASIEILDRWITYSPPEGSC